jgi:hypothetical protein
MLTTLKAPSETALGEEISHHAHVDLGLALPHQGDGLKSELIEVGLQSLKELSAQAIAGGLRSPAVTLYSSKTRALE